MTSLGDGVESFEVDGVRLRWLPAERLVEMDFLPPPRSPGETEARACIGAIRAWAGEGPFRLLVDCRNIRDTQAAWRRAFADLAREPGRDVRFAWYNMSPLIRVTVSMFLRASGIPGRAFATEEEARAWVMRPEAGP